jgi:uncharacterized protein (DUF1800 family)
MVIKASNTDCKYRSATAARGSHHRSHLRRPIAILIGLVLLCNNGPARADQLASPAVDARTAAHFLEQASFGPTAADMAAVQTLGPEGWLDSQFQLPESLLLDGLDTNQVRNQLFLNMANGPDQLRQRMIFALSQTLVVSANKNGNGEELIPWVRLLSRNAFGNYRTLLREVTVSPTMGKFLDLVYSKKASSTTAPNENYVREMLQLFSIGLWQLNQDGTLKRDAQNQPIPSYSQNTIKEFARALTGWTYPTKPDANASNSNPSYFVGEMLPRVTTHDAGAKTLLNGVTLPAGQTTEQDMEAVIDNVFQHPNVPPFIATRLIRSLVSSNPSPAYISRVASVFENNGAGVRGDLRAVLTAVLLDPEALGFTSPEAGRLKDPILHVIGMARALGALVTDPNQYMYVFSNLSQRVLTPQTVFSFYSPLAFAPGHTDLIGPEFQIYPPALAIQRANFVYGLLNGQFGAGFALNRVPYQAVAGDPAALVEMVNQNLMFGRMSNELRQIIIAATTAVPASDVVQRALGALYLAAISSEYSVYSSINTNGVVSVQPPTGLIVSSIVGNVVTLRWIKPAIGPAPTAYVLEGGMDRGQTLASMPTGSVAPTVTFTAPPGAFYVRVRSMSGASMSRASSEIRVHVDVPTGPTAPANLLGVVKGSSVGLSWRNTFGGGAPTSLMLDVSGDATVSVPLGLAESFTFDGVPPGTYKFSVRALNASGSSGGSNPVTLTFPNSGCSGRPQTPINFIASAAGRIVSLNWQAAVSGPAATSFYINVSGAAVGRVPVTVRTLSAGVGPGTYNISIQSVNACGNSSPTAQQTLVIQ